MIMNFQAFALRDLKMAAREGCRVGQKMSYRLSFANWKVLSKTRWQMFRLLYGGHVCVPQKDTNMESSYKAL